MIAFIPMSAMMRPEVGDVVLCGVVFDLRYEMPIRYGYIYIMLCGRGAVKASELC